jgi:parallel beta-helix repeat protein
MLRAWFGQLRSPRTSASRPSQRRASVRPRLEALEDRFLPSTATLVFQGSTIGTYSTIGQALTHAAPLATSSSSPATINLNGTFTEQVAVTTSFIILQKASGATTATIQAPANLTGSMDIVDVNGVTGVTISGLAIQGPSMNLKAGIQVENGGSATISSNTITNIREADNNRSGNQSGIGVLIGGDTNGVFTPATANITGNAITTYQKGGIIVENTGSSATVSSNNVTGLGRTNGIAQNGIEVGFGATATVSSNTVSANIYGKASLTGFAAADILLYQPGNGTTVSNNIVTSTDVGIWALDANSATISNNSVSGFDFFGIALDIVSTGCSNVTVSNNSVQNSTGPAPGIILFNATGCTLSNNSVNHTGIGIWLAGGDTNDIIKQNTVQTNSLYGVLVADFDSTKPNNVGTTSTSSGNTFSQNTITGNNTSGQTGVFDATDLSHGSGTAGTADTWSNDTIGTSNPHGLH